MDPINYNLVNPAQAIMQGLQGGLGVLGAQQQVQQQQQQLQQQQALAGLVSNPNAGHADYAAVMTAYPALAENLGKAWKVRSEGEQQNAINFGSRVYSSMLTGDNAGAVQMLRDRAKADPVQAQHWTALADMAEKAPAYGKTIGAMTLAGLMGPDKFKEAFTGLGSEARATELQPAAVAKAKAEAVKTGAEAQTETVKAANAPTAAALSNEKDVQSILSSEAQRKVADFNAQISAANSETERGRLTLERDKFIADQKLKGNQLAQDNQNTFDTITDSLSTVRSLQKDLTADGFFGKWLGVGSTFGKLLGYVPGTDAKDFRAKLETLKSKQFLAQAQQLRGMGALSNAEGERIERAVASLDPDQSIGAFKNALGVIETTLARGHQKLIAQGQLPTNGGAFVMRHPVYGNIGEADITRLMASQPGTTREQVIQYLKETGGK